MESEKKVEVEDPEKKKKKEEKVFHNLFLLDSFVTTIQDYLSLIESSRSKTVVSVVSPKLTFRPFCTQLLLFAKIVIRLTRILLYLSCSSFPE